MNTYVKYEDISKAERIRLSDEAYGRSPGLRVMRITLLLLPIFIAGALTDALVPKGESFFVGLGVNVLCATLLSVMLWQTVGRQRLKVEIEKLKNEA